ncbi:MAG: LuxR C-terminal-related transcriptional regulator [Vicinamibacteria bacterium]
MLSGSDRDTSVLQALRAGARAYVSLQSQVNDLPDIIRQVAGGTVFLSREASAVVAAAVRDPHSGHDVLTVRERQVLQLVAEGHSTKQTAAILGISVKTAACHRARLMEKLDIHEVATLTHYAIRERIISL